MARAGHGPLVQTIGGPIPFSVTHNELSEVQQPNSSASKNEFRETPGIRGRKKGPSP